MNNLNLPNSFKNRGPTTPLSSSSNKSMTYLKEMIPEKDGRFDSNELMTIDLIKTPGDAKFRDESYIELLKGDFSKGFPTSPLLSILEIRNRMVCHQDFPRLLGLLNYVKRAETSKGNPLKGYCDEETNAIAMSMKEELGAKNFTIAIGECPLTDHTMQSYFTMLYSELKAKTMAVNVATGKASITPIKVLPYDQNDEVTYLDLISWSEDFLKTSELFDRKSISPLAGCKSQARGKDKLFPKKTAKVKKMKAVRKKKTEKKKSRIPFSVIASCAAPIEAFSETTLKGKGGHVKDCNSDLQENKNKQAFTRNCFKDCVEDLSKSQIEINESTKARSFKLDVQSVHSFCESPSPTVTSDIGICLTPHPFKRPVNNCFPLSEVKTTSGDPLSEITIQDLTNSVTFVRNKLGLSVAIPGVRLFCDGGRTEFSYPKRGNSKTDEKNKCVLTTNENHETSNVPSSGANFSNLMPDYSIVEKKYKIMSATKENGDSSDKKSLAFDESGTPSNSKNIDSVGKNIEKEKLLSELKSPRLLAVSFL